ncbi:MAG TPA: glycosyltransferase [Desulfotomaculum sp.]|jgi:N-acetylglucosaminyldiphosphoundecaprenol N-acetyl-beta-D-mannosaminyltransferase|nr:glycosyltransferase [Desulfotomaculum sp.]
MRVKILGAWVDALKMEEAEEQIAGFVRSGRPHQVVTLNPEILYRVQQEPELLDLINHAHLVTADGTGVVWACRVAGQPIPERVTGIDLMLRLVARSAKEGWRIFLLGGEPGVAQEASRRLQQRYPRLLIAGAYHGYFSNTGNSSSHSEVEVIEMIRSSHSQLLFAGMGAPRQDQFIARNLNHLHVHVAMGVGGSFDVVAGRVARAPAWMQRMRVEWLGRLLKEPCRIKRVLVLPKFVWLVIRHSLSNR